MPLALHSWMERGWDGGRGVLQQQEGEGLGSNVIIKFSNFVHNQQAGMGLIVIPFGAGVVDLLEEVFFVAEAEDDAVLFVLGGCAATERSGITTH